MQAVLPFFNTLQPVLYREVAIPVREIPKSFRNVTGKVYSLHGKRLVGFESTLEKDLFLLLDFDLNVDRYEEQPVTLSYDIRPGLSSTYTPDVLVHYRTDIAPAAEKRPELIEVKCRDDLKANWSKLKLKFKAAHRYAKIHGWVFKILTEREIRTPLLENVRFLTPYRRHTNHSDISAMLLRGMERLGETTPTALLATVFKDRWDQAKALPELWRLISDQRVGANLKVPLTMQSRIWCEEQWLDAK